MTFKKNYDNDRDALRQPKSRNATTRQDARIKHALRHGDLDALHDDELDEMGIGHDLNEPADYWHAEDDDE